MVHYSMTPLSWNTDVEVLANGKKRHSISCRRWKNYRKQNGVWQKINTAVQPDRTVSKFSADIQFPVNVQDWTTVTFNSSFSPKVKLFDKIGNNAEPDFLLDVSAETDHNVAGITGFENNPSWMGYPNSWDGADLIYEVNQNAACRLKKLVRINSEPAGSSTFVAYNFLIRSPHAKIFTGKNRKTRPWDGTPGQASELNGNDAWVSRSQGDYNSEIRGTTIETPACWYTKLNGEVVRQNVRVVFSIQGDGQTVRATKHIPRSMIQAAMAEGSPLFADTIFRTDDVDAVGSDHTSYWTGNDTWTNARGANGTAWSDHFFGYFNYMISASTTTDQYDDIRRVFLFYDTSALSGSVTAASLDIHGNGASDTFPLLSETNIYGSTSTGTTSGAASDFQTFQTTPFATAVAWVPSSTWETYTFNSSGRSNIDVSGFSRFCVGFVDDIENIEPTWSSGKEAYFNVRFSEYAGDYGPRLDVTTGVAGISIPLVINQLRQQGIL